MRSTTAFGVSPILFAIVLGAVALSPLGAQTAGALAARQETVTPGLQSVSFQPPSRTLLQSGGCRFLSFSADAAFLAASSFRDEVSVFETATGKPVWGWRYPEWLRTSLGDIVWPFSPLARQGWSDGNWQLHEVPGQPKGWPGDAAALFALRGHELAVVHDPCLSNTHVIVGSQSGVSLHQGVWLLGGYVHLFDDPDLTWQGTVEVDQPKRLPPRGVILYGLPPVTAFSFNPEGDLAATGSAEGMLKLWDTRSGSLVAQTQVEARRNVPPRINQVSFSPDGRLLASIGGSGVVRVWSVPGLARQSEFVGHTGSGFWVQFSPDGRQLGSAADDGDLRLWDLSTGATTRTVDWRKHVGENPIFGYLPQGGGILYGATREKAVIGLLATRPGGIECSWRIDLPNLSALTWSPTGAWLAAADRDGTILVWQVAWALYAGAS